MASLPSKALPPAKALSAAGTEYVYICASPQMPKGVYKVGETHTQTPEQRAKQFTGVDRLVHWHVVRSFPTPDSRFTEKRVHAQLVANGTRYGEHREMFQAELSDIVAIIEKSVAATPARAHNPLTALKQATVTTRARGPWAAALQMPVSHQKERGFTLAHAMGSLASRNPALRQRLLQWGIEMVNPDPRKPAFRIYAVEDSPFAKWLKARAISWEDLGLVPGGSFKITCDLTMDIS
jgi:hypothetical protein